MGGMDMGKLQVGSAEAAPGEIAFGSLPAGKLSDSSTVNIPVIAINGTQEGPTVVMTAALHGPEITGVEVIRRVCRELVQPSNLRGAIIAIPVANPYGFRTASWINLEDGININRAFPGGDRDWLTPRVAAVLLNNVISKADVVVDLHAMCEPSILFVIVKQTADREAFRKSLDLARLFGLPIAVSVVGQRPAHRAGSLIEVASERGIPGVAPEFQYWRRLVPSSVQVGVEGVLKVLRRLEMIDGEIRPQAALYSTVPSVFRLEEIFSNEGGLAEFVVAPAEPVRQGDTIVRIRNPYGDLLEEVGSPRDGFLVGYPVFNSQAVRTGEMLAFVGVPYDPDGQGDSGIQILTG